MIQTVVVTRKLEKHLESGKIPKKIIAKFFAWIASVERNGLEEVRKISGYHDEPLQGIRKGERSIRLDKQWRAIYIIENGEAKVTFIEVKEITPHDY